MKIKIIIMIHKKLRELEKAIKINNNLKPNIMKLRILAIIIALFAVTTSCTKEQGPAKYNFAQNVEIPPQLEIDVIIFEYTDAGDKVHSNQIENLNAWQEYKFTASSELVTKLKVYLNYGTPYSSETRWVQNVFLLDKEEINYITLDENTLIGSNEP